VIYSKSKTGEGKFPASNTTTIVFPLSRYLHRKQQRCAFIIYNRISLIQIPAQKTTEMCIYYIQSYFPYPDTCTKKHSSIPLTTENVNAVIVNNLISLIQMPVQENKH
jgi:hypothetical protein